MQREERKQGIEGIQILSLRKGEARSKVNKRPQEEKKDETNAKKTIYGED